MKLCIPMPFGVAKPYPVCGGRSPSPKSRCSPPYGGGGAAPYPRRAIRAPPAGRVALLVSPNFGGMERNKYEKNQLLTKNLIFSPLIINFGIDVT